MTSFSASNFASIGTTNTRQTTKKPPNSSDIGWQFGKFISSHNHNDMQCKKYGLISKGRINRLKQHIVSWKRDVRPCPNSTDEEKTICSHNFETAKIRRFAKKAYLKLRKKVKIDCRGAKSLI